MSQGRGKAEGRIGGVDKWTTLSPSLHLRVHTHSMHPMTTDERRMNANAALAEHGTPVAAFRLRLHPKRTRSCPSTPSCPHPHMAPPQPAHSPPLWPTTARLQLSKGRPAAPVVGLRTREECVPVLRPPRHSPAQPPLSPRFASPCPDRSQRSLYTDSCVELPLAAASHDDGARGGVAPKRMGAVGIDPTTTALHKVPHPPFSVPELPQETEEVDSYAKNASDALPTELCTLSH